ncbi:MAG TPA: hypothetical protein VF614_06230 [Chthoniobacteraceae bacterium]|jgi:hypothetical protein
MSAGSDLQKVITDMLGGDGALRVSVPVLALRDKEKSLVARLDKASADKGLCIFVQPLLPLRAMQGVPFVFFEAAELRVRIIERMEKNASGADAYDLLEDVANALQWQPTLGITSAVTSRMEAESEDEATALAAVEADSRFANLFKLRGIVSHPLQLAGRPCEMLDDTEKRVIDVLFEATYQLPPHLASIS